MDPREQRAAAHAAAQADPAAAAHTAAVVARIRTRPWWTHTTHTRPTTSRQAWADFNAAEAADERERNRHS